MDTGRLLGGIPFEKLSHYFNLCKLFDSVKSTFYGAVNNESRVQFHFRFRRNIATKRKTITSLEFSPVLTMDSRWTQN